MSYACSDIHGLWDRYARMKKYTKNEDVYILGDVIDRGPDGIRILKDIMNTPRMHLLLGNHEHMMIRALYHNDIRALKHWIIPENGGAFTKDAFLKESVTTQEKILDYLNGCYITKSITESNVTYGLTHSGPAQLDLLYSKASSQEREKAMWYSPYRDDTYISFEAYDAARIWLIGHVPVQTLFDYQLDEYKAVIHNNIIDIDCGCVFQSISGVDIDNSLAVYNMDDYSLEYIK